MRIRLADRSREPACAAAEGRGGREGGTAVQQDAAAQRPPAGSALRGHGPAPRCADQNGSDTNGSDTNGSDTEA